MKKEKRKLKIYKIIILIILLIILIITSFKSGEKFFILRNTNFNSSIIKNDSSIARWYFNAKINY